MLSQQLVVTLSSRLRFPVLLGRVFAVDTSQGLRVEPLSAVQTAQWDVLVTTGRLELLDRHQRMELAYGKWEDPLIGVVAAYAAYIASQRKDLETILNNTRGLFGPSQPCDLELLDLIQRHPRGGRLNSRELERLDRLAFAGAVPAFRWGVPLALDLLARAQPRPALVEWAKVMRAVEERLSLLSIWTAWREPVPRRPIRARGLKRRKPIFIP